MTDQNLGFCRYQWSIFTRNGKDEQYVVRANDIESFKLEIANIKTFLHLDDKVTTTPLTDSIKQTEEVSANPMYCKVHKWQNGPVEMKERVAKSGAKWYDHRRQNENDEWETCKGFGYPSEKA